MNSELEDIPHPEPLSCVLTHQLTSFYTDYYLADSSTSPSSRFSFETFLMGPMTFSLHSPLLSPILSPTRPI
jgi:hypothetical protein